MPIASAAPSSRLAHQRALTNQQLSRTLLFMPVAQQYRPWDLRSYSGGQLAGLSGREKAYGYRSPERFLSEVAQAGGSETLTDGLAGWTYRLWSGQFGSGADQEEPATFYVDGHHKAVYSDKLLPRGLVGRLGKVLGCRGLVLLHDAKGHPLLALTSRGDKHLTKGLPEVVARFEQAVGNQFKIRRIVADREVMAGEFLVSELTEQREIVTILKENQYQTLDSFEEVGEFSPWLGAKLKERVIGEVAPATFTLKVTSPLTGQPLRLKVALLRNLRRPKSAETGPKLIPIVTSSLAAEVKPLSSAQALALATAYRNRWPLQENVIKDWLLPVGLDINHGFAKSFVENSEVSKRREYLQERIATTRKRAASARQRSNEAEELNKRRHQKLQILFPKRQQELNKLYDRLVEEATPRGLSCEQKMEYQEAKKKVEAELEREQGLEWQAHRNCNKEYRKAQAYEEQGKELRGQLEKLNSGERQMLELDQRKDQVMTVFKLALVNLGMWVRERCFPVSYAQCSWQRLQPFFELGGWVSQQVGVVKVTLQPFNDRALNRDLAQVCELASGAGLVLPDGRRLQLEVAQEQAMLSKKPSLGKICAIRRAAPGANPVSLYSVSSNVG